MRGRRRWWRTNLGAKIHTVYTQTHRRCSGFELGHGFAGMETARCLLPNVASSAAQILKQLAFPPLLPFAIAAIKAREREPPVSGAGWDGKDNQNGVASSSFFFYLINIFHLSPCLAGWAERSFSVGDNEFSSCSASLVACRFFRCCATPFCAIMTVTEGVNPPASTGGNESLTEGKLQFLLVECAALLVNYKTM